ncbi:amidohydrolase [Deminuibacter soli]|uniref:Amidohydrolase n=2 Tax=Deminuibacter soli TaxID=2291815 RepID=A0A3E1NHW8_9BACT|nr:amidohydrolase [Deminuibacter soli]
MKLITIEEHLNDPAIAAATAKVLGPIVPYTSITTDNLPGGVLENAGAERLARMDAAGIDMQILSYINSPQFLPASEAIPLTKAANNRLAEAIKAHPDRFAAFAMLPLGDPEASAEELKRCVKELGFKGALIAGRPAAAAKFLDDPFFAPVLEAANELKVPIYMHPGYPHKDVQKVYYSGFDSLVTSLFSLYAWGWHNEAGIQIIRMILAGVFDKYPNLQLISGHWGEMVPFFLYRMDGMLPQQTTHLQQSILNTYKNHIYVTPSGMFTWPQFQFTLEVLGADRIIYSVDYPYVQENNAREFLNNAPISNEDREKIAHGNAEKLFKLPHN